MPPCDAGPPELFNSVARRRPAWRPSSRSSTSAPPWSGCTGILSYVKKLGYSVGELGERILLRVITDYTGDDEFFDNSMEAVRTARKFRDMMPAGMRDRYEVVPIVTDPYEGALWHFGTTAAVIDR